MDDSGKGSAGGSEISPKDTSLPPPQSDAASKASKKSAGSAGSGGHVDGYPSQISYNANAAANGHHIRMQTPPPLNTGQPNGSYQFNGSVPGGYPPPHHVHYQMSSSPVMMTNNQPPPGITPYPPGGGNFPTQMMNPGSGLPPTSPAMQYAPQDMNGGSTRQRYRRDNHRRSNSYNGPIGSYGSMDTQQFFAPTGSGAPPLPRRNKKRTGSADFSPVSEIRKLTGSERGIRPPVSPRVGGARSHNRAKSEDWQGSPAIPLMHAPPVPFPSPASGTSPSPMNYQQQQGQPMVFNRGVYMGDDDFAGSIHAMNGNGLSSSLRSLRKNSEDDGSDAGGEAVFLLNKTSSHNKSTRGKGRSKKRHMRQRSAQLFMEEVKGTEQLPACRDIVFVLFFAFHLLGIINLGMTYGNEALRLHDESLEDSESSVTIIFTNLIYVAGLSGVFAMVVSGLTLLLMTSIANKIVQIAIILSITFSFVWGTMGIGLSPNNIVPITGIVALTLSVAYAFIVWDRIPFAAANLHAGLSGILANPGAVFVSFVFQVLALGWSIYYIFVIGGVYDAIQIGDINESPGIQYVYFGLLGVSYYWTLNVFLVSSRAEIANEYYACHLLEKYCTRKQNLFLCLFLS